MDNKCKMEGLEEAPLTRIFRVPGEPAVMINGLPPMPKTDAADGDVSASNALPKDTKPPENTYGFGEWLVGREVVKLFEGYWYTGKITRFDEETNWYRVVYEDGDSEDLEWSELEHLLRPLDITIPLKSLATKVLKKQQKSGQKPAETEAGTN